MVDCISRRRGLHDVVSRDRGAGLGAERVQPAAITAPHGQRAVNVICR